MMPSEGFEWLDEGFAFLDTSQCSLAVQLGNSDVRFAITDNAQKCVVLKKIPFTRSLEMDEWAERFSLLAENEAFFKQSYKQISIAVSTCFYTLVPKEYYEKRYEKSYLDLNFTMPAFESSFETQTLKEESIEIPFLLPEPLEKLLKKLFPKAVLLHETAVWLELLLKEDKSAHKTLHLNVHKDFLNVIVLEGQKVILSNSFSFQTPTDFLYYVMLTVRELKIREHEEIRVYGDIESGGALCVNLEKYGLRLRWPVGNTYSTSPLPTNYYYTLLQQHTCAS